MKRVKKIVSIMLAAILTLCSGTVSAFAQQEDSSTWEAKKAMISEMEKEGGLSEDEQNRLSQMAENMMLSTMDIGDHIMYENEYNDDTENADRIYNDYTVIGDTAESLYDFDYYKFTLTEKSIVSISCVSENRYGLIFGVCDSNGEVLVGSIDTGYNDGFYGDGVVYIFEPGTYYICILDEYTEDYDDALAYLFYYYAEPAGDSSFVDVVPGKFYYDAVVWGAQNGIVNGTSDITFSPDEPCTRGQVVTFLWRTYTEQEILDVDHPFTDVNEKAFYYNAMLWAVENGITKGMSETTFCPENPCTRGQVVTFLWRVCGEPAPASDENPFTDVDENAFYYDAMLWAVENGITYGLSATKFVPNATCTRGQIVTFLYRAVNNL